MRPLRLDLHGFTVFREPTTVDLTDADFFALVGPTGSGKSTVLDAICFALFGTVPRWGDRRRIEHALAPSATEAKVRLVFEAAGARFVATRVVRRDGKGRVTTSHAGLEQLPPGFDLTTFDTAPAQRGEAGLGTVLAGTPAEMDEAVAEAVGLPYEQFTSCVVLPQGEFARFLHAKPAHRQEILVNLLGLGVYQRIGERAGVLAREAVARAAATRGVLAELADADEAAQAAAGQALARAAGLAEEVEAQLPALAEAATRGEAARLDLARIEQEITALAAVRTPAGVATLAAEVAAAAELATTADRSAIAAEEKEDKLRAELAVAGDRTALQRLADSYAERDRLDARAQLLSGGLASAMAEHGRIGVALAKAQRAQQLAEQAQAAAQHAVVAAQTADRAAALRGHLVPGEPCPVCEQPVVVVPAVPQAPALAAAQAGLAEAERAVALRVAAVRTHDGALREADRAVATAAAQHQEAARRLAAVAAALDGAPAPAAVRDGLAAIAAAEVALATAAGAVRTARQAARRAAAGHVQAAGRLGQAWRVYDRARDALATFGPPPADRDDLVASWATMTAWADGARVERTRSRRLSLAAAEAALTAIEACVARLDETFRQAGATPAGPAGPAGDPAGYRQAAVLAVERADAAYRRVVDRREQAARLAQQVAEHERAAQVAKTLALHLRADRFERWLLVEALDALVAGASGILRDLSGGQYDLAHDKGEFFVVDHSDAGLRRGVRTLSGGETFQAALALALALSEQLAGLSTASASLESIMLDEGFGTLDEATLDIVAATLENLAARGDRMVGVVTHVPALADRIPVRFQLTRDAHGVARIERVA